MAHFSTEDKRKRDSVINNLTARGVGKLHRGSPGYILIFVHPRLVSPNHETPNCMIFVDLIFIESAFIIFIMILLTLSVLGLVKHLTSFLWPLLLIRIVFLDFSRNSDLITLSSKYEKFQRLILLAL